MEERLARIEQQQARTIALLEGLQATVQDRIAASDRWRAKVDRVLQGDGNGYRGLLVRVDRLEQAQERQRWLVRVLVGAIVPLAAKAVLDLLNM